MLDRSWLESAQINQALVSNGATLHPFSDGSDLVPGNLDEFSQTVREMPPGETPSEIISGWLNNPNQAVKSSLFDFYVEFTRTDTTHPPQVGDIYHLDFFGPDDGDLMLVEKTPTHFIFEMLSTPDYGSPPIYGTREFGYRTNDDPNCPYCPFRKGS